MKKIQKLLSKQDSESFTKKELESLQKKNGRCYKSGVGKV